MNATEALRLAKEHGIHIGVEGADLVLRASRAPAPRILEVIRLHKADIVATLLREVNEETAEDWQGFFAERAGVAEFEGDLPRPEAEARAFEYCIAQWLNRHPATSDFGRCAWCGTPDHNGHAVVPFGAEGHGHTWLHPECWQDWFLDQRERARQALAAMGLTTQ